MRGRIRHAVVASLLLGTPAAAQGPWGLGPIGTTESRGMPAISRLARGHQNVNYDGRWTYARIAFTARGGANFLFGGRGGGDPLWDHDYPNSDRNMPTILAAITNLRARSDGSVIVRADDPDLFRFPFAYICEVGGWMPTDPEVTALRAYLIKGGFLIVDDFDGPAALENFLQHTRRILPNAALVPLAATHPIFDAFYRITDFSIFVNNGGGGAFRRGGARGYEPGFYGIFEDNDPTKRMLMVVNHNFDVSELWEYSGTGLFPVAETNEAYKLGINYIMYTLTR